MTRLTQTARDVLQACGFEHPFTKAQLLFVLWFLYGSALALIAASTAGLPELMR